MDAAILQVQCGDFSRAMCQEHATVFVSDCCRGNQEKLGWLMGLEPVTAELQSEESLRIAQLRAVNNKSISRLRCSARSPGLPLFAWLRNSRNSATVGFHIARKTHDPIMSGPITAGFFFIHGSLLLSARALREARSMKREFGEVREQLRAREEEIARTRRGQQEARLERLVALRTRAGQQQARLARLRSLAETLAAARPEIAAKLAPATLSQPSDDDDAGWTRFLGELDAAVRDVEVVLANAGGRFAERLRSTAATASRAPTIDDVLSAYVLQREMQSGLNAEETGRLRATAARILGRVELPEGASLPTHLESLARAIVLAPSIERAEALALELRHAVQTQREEAAAQRAEAEEARGLLLELPEDAPAPLVEALERVAAKVERFDARLRKSVQDLLAEAAADHAQIEQEAAALVLKASLEDLGYEVEDIESTLFVDGGTVHFRRSGWENYFVRLRVDPVDRTVNFNVVRARGDEESAERRRLDALAEDRWCAEFPRLMQTLMARGLQLDVTRRLAAGEVPVQVVDRANLPAAAADEQAVKSRPPPLARPR